MNAYKYKNFINKDPILDLLKLQSFYKKDNELPGFDEQLLLENYTRNNKRIFCSKIFEKIGPDAIKIAPDAFIMKTRNLAKHFKNHQGYVGKNYSMFTIEYSSIKILKSGDVTSSNVYYNFKNWLHTKESTKTIDNSFLLGRRYNEYPSFDYLARMPYEFDDVLQQAEKHLKNLPYKKIGVDVLPNMKNTSDFPYHNAKKIISNEYPVIIEPRSEEQFVNFNKLPLFDETDTQVLYIDFEMLTSVYDDFTSFPRSNDKIHLFNIGFCSKNLGEKSFISKDLQDEMRMFTEFIEYLNSLEQDSVTFVHWTKVEKTIFNSKILEYKDVVLSKKIKWFDLHEYFVKSDVYIKGCPNYKLKIVSRFLENMGAIKTKWDNALFFDGLGAMTGFIKYLRTRDSSILENIVKYNAVDCKVLMEIVDFIKMKL